MWGIVAVVFGPFALLAVGMSPTATEFAETSDMCEKCGLLKKAYHSETSFRDESGRYTTITHCTGPATAYQMQQLMAALERIQPPADK